MGSTHWVRISSTFSVLRPTDFTSTSLIRLAYFDLLSNLDDYWPSSTGRSKVLVEVKFGQKSRSNFFVEVKSVGRCAQKVEDMKMILDFSKP